MKLKSYPKYKDSGVQWIGEVPEDWKVQRGKFQFKVTGGYAFPSDDFVEEGISLVRIGDVSEGTVNLDNCKKLPEEYALTKKDFLLNEKEVLVAMTGATIGKIGQVPKTSEKMLLNQRVGRVKTKFSSDYYKYVLTADFIKEQIRLIAEGAAQENISSEQIESFVIPKLDEENHKNISSFLDSKKSQLDQTIEKGKQLIELLKEKRTALINHVVTKGLDKNAKMKDSGIDWIGEIPEGWEIKRLRFNCNINPTGKKVFSDDKTKVAFLPMEKVSVHGEYDSESTAEYWEVSSGFTYFINNDVLVAKITPCFENGKGAMVTNLVNGIGFGTTEFHVLRSYRNIIPKYLYYFTKTHFFRTIGEVFMKGSAGQQRISTDFTKDFCMMTPPKETQIQIVQYLDKETSRIDKIIKNIEEKINLIEEYKKSLIHHVVTGKVDVRGEV